MALLRAEAKHAHPPRDFLDVARDLLTQDGLDVSGPVPAPMQRRAGFLRMQLLVTAKDRKALQAALARVVPQLYAAPEARKVRWSLDVDPIDLY
jgi:primosomal protein N' (replication factor Y)